MDTTRNLCDFIDASPTAFHAADNLRGRLQAFGAIELDEKDEWQLEPGVSYFVCRGASSVLAFRPGIQSLGRAGYALACAHTDSPALKVRADSCINQEGMLRVAIDVYGDAILSTWLDRPLALAGRVIILKQGKLGSALYNSDRPVGVIPNLAIHLNREINKGMEYNIHQHLPVLVDVGLQTGEGRTDEASKTSSACKSWMKELVAHDLGVDPADILGMDLSFHDFQKAIVFGGQTGQPGQADGDLVNSSRLDDLAGCHAILQAFCGSKPAVHTQLACFFDAEEIGSMTPQGANSNFLRDILARLAIAGKEPAEDFYRANAKSYCLSCDVAQAWNPAYPEKFDLKHSPLLGGGVALKSNINQRYGTDALTGAVFVHRCQETGIPCQSYMVRADMQSGRTIGPMIAERLGLRTIDIGHPLLSMHSIRETVHGLDHASMIEAIGGFFSRLPEA
ncbi:MAG: M18 family aminopeptidase [Spirochaetaceae bacterium]|nr:M18 family aminopeptidase [Spirochaetaceae bacterium]